MAITRVFRPVLIVALFALGGCVVPPPQPVPPGSVVMSQQCSAGFYQCVLPQAGQVGTPCACPGLGAPSYGVIR
jgi:hypothetical protein